MKVAVLALALLVSSAAVAKEQEEKRSESRCMMLTDSQVQKLEEQSEEIRRAVRNIRSISRVFSRTYRCKVCQDNGYAPIFLCVTDE